MKKVYLFACLIVLISTVSSCKKCYHCEINAEYKATITDVTYYSFDICNTGKESGHQFENMIADYKTNGYSCTAKK